MVTHSVIKSLIIASLFQLSACGQSTSTLSTEEHPPTKARPIKSQKDLERYYDRNQANISQIMPSAKKKVNFKELGQSVFKLGLYVDGAYVANGSGFFIHKDGYFITTRHGFEDCLDFKHIEKKEFHSQPVSCNDIEVDGQTYDFKVTYKGKLYPTSIVSYVPDYHVNETLKGKWKKYRSLHQSAVYHAVSNDLILGRIEGDLPEIDPVRYDHKEDPTPLTKELATHGFGSFGERMFAVGVLDDETIVYGGCITNVSRCLERENCESDQPLAYGSYVHHIGPLNEFWKSVDGKNGISYANRPIHDVFLKAVPGMSGGPLIDITGSIKGVGISASDETSTFISWHKVLTLFFTETSTDDPLITLTYNKIERLAEGRVKLTIQPMRLKRSAGISSFSGAHISPGNKATQR